MTYIPSDNWLICDVCGFKKRVSETRRRWDNAVVCSDTCFEVKHPQESIRMPKERISSPVSRPEQTDNFLTDNEVTPEDL